MTLFDPFRIVKYFETVLAEYCGSKYAVAVDSCTNALLLCCTYLGVKEVEIPKRTYVGVPMSIIHAGGRVRFRDETWSGAYRLEPYAIYDSARRLRRGMYLEFPREPFQPWPFVCLSFHWAKTLGIGRGGAILTNSTEAVAWFKRARFDGRAEGVPPKEDPFPILGWHFYMTPEQASSGLVRLRLLPDDNPDLPWDDYPDLSKVALFCDDRR